MESLLRHGCLVVGLVLLGTFLTGCSDDTQPGRDAGGPELQPFPDLPLYEAGSGPRLLQSSDLVYAGAFRLPPGDHGPSSFEYGGTALAYNAASDSLYLVGHDWHQMVAEIKIPAIKSATSINDLAVATVLQPFVDATSGKMSTVGSDTVKVGGLLVHGGKLNGSVYVYYDASGEQVVSHFTHALALSDQASFKGIFQVGSLGAGMVSGYMTGVPAEWQATLGGPALTGQCCIPIVTRTSWGPGVFVFNPQDLGVKQPAPAAPLVYYNQDHATLGQWDGTNKLFNGSTMMGGIVLPEGTRSLLFIGRHGTGTFCYGTGGASGGECVDPTDDSKGNHAYPYIHQVWAYDVLDLSAVKQGKKQPWEITPYQTWSFDLPFQTAARQINGVAWDSKGRRIFLTEALSDGDLPLVHVFTVK